MIWKEWLKVGLNTNTISLKMIFSIIILLLSTFTFFINIPFLFFTDKKWFHYLPSFSLPGSLCLKCFVGTRFFSSFVFFLTCFLNFAFFLWCVSIAPQPSAVLFQTLFVNCVSFFNLEMGCHLIGPMQLWQDDCSFARAESSAALVMLWETHHIVKKLGCLGPWTKWCAKQLQMLLHLTHFKTESRFISTFWQLPASQKVWIWAQCVFSFKPLLFADKTMQPFFLNDNNKTDDFKSDCWTCWKLMWWFVHSRIHIGNLCCAQRGINLEWNCIVFSSLHCEWEAGLSMLSLCFLTMFLPVTPCNTQNDKKTEFFLWQLLFELSVMSKLCLCRQFDIHCKFHLSVHSCNTSFIHSNLQSVMCQKSNEWFIHKCTTHTHNAGQHWKKIMNCHWVCIFWGGDDAHHLDVHFATTIFSCLHWSLILGCASCHNTSQQQRKCWFCIFVKLDQWSQTFALFSLFPSHQCFLVESEHCAKEVFVFSL